jgi:hypothetical protein
MVFYFEILVLLFVCLFLVVGVDTNQGFGHQPRLKKVIDLEPCFLQGIFNKVDHLVSLIVIGGDCYGKSK